jgi:hypothetical protein
MGMSGRIVRLSPQKSSGPKAGKEQEHPGEPAVEIYSEKSIIEKIGRGDWI